MDNKIQCTACKVYKNENDFKKNDKTLKTCFTCRTKYNCEHKRRRTNCKDCGGSSICEHKRLRNRCKDCGGSQLCKSELCETRVSNKKYKGYCLFCFIHLFPDEPNSRNYKTKEKDVVDRITKRYTNFTWFADKKVQDGCSRRRPDLLLDMG